MYLKCYSTGLFLVLLIITSVRQCCSQLTSVTDCTCSNNTVILRCRFEVAQIHDQPFTHWSGTAFESCVSGILLRPANFYTVHTCGNGISAYGVDVRTIADTDIKEYISKLEIPMNPTLNDTNVECRTVQRDKETLVDSTTLILSEDYPPPSNITLSGILSNQLDFTWNMAKTCPDLRYGVTGLNCDCVINDTPNSESATCTNLHTGSECIISVHSIVCSNIIGSEMTTSSIATQVPTAPEIFCVPTYTAEASNNYLTLVNTSIIMPSEEWDNTVPVNKFTVYHYISDTLCGTKSIKLNSCQFPVTSCSVEFNFRGSDCSSSTSMQVKVTIKASATNIFGEGPLSPPVEIDGVNNFVKITFNSVTQSATCTFLNQEAVLREKTCSLHLSYGQNCSKHLSPETKQTNIDSISFSLDILRPAVTYCYSLNAMSGNLTVNQEGTFNLDDVLVIVLIVALIFVVLAISGPGLFCAGFCFYQRIRRARVAHNDENHNHN